MARLSKTKWLGARVDPELSKAVEEHIEARGMTMGELIRAAVKEYLWAHPPNSKAATQLPAGSTVGGKETA